MSTTRTSSWPMSLVVLLLAAVLVSIAPGAAQAGESSGIVSGVANAPITPDGDVAGAMTDLVITLDRSIDPAVLGRSLLEGGTIKVTLPEDFVSLGLETGNPGTCAPCNTGVLLQGWPQNPVPPAPTNYLVSSEGTHTIVYTAARDLDPSDPTLNGPGIKQMHLILFGFVNPGPGMYDIVVEAETGPDGALETGIAVANIRPDARKRVISVTSAFADGDGALPNPNTIYQETDAGAPIPYPWDFLVWDRAGAAGVGMEVHQVDDHFGYITQIPAVVGPVEQPLKIVGHVSVAGPAGAVFGTASPSVEITAPVLGLPAGHMVVDFTAGNPGSYEITLEMNGGSSVTMFVEAEDTAS